MQAAGKIQCFILPWCQHITIKKKETPANIPNVLDELNTLIWFGGWIEVFQ